MTDIKLEIQNGKRGSKTKVAKKEVNKPDGIIPAPVQEGIDYAERIFKIKQLEYELDGLENQTYSDDITPGMIEALEIDRKNQIGKIKYQIYQHLFDQRSFPYDVLDEKKEKRL